MLNEKGAVAAAGRLPHAPAGFAERAHRLLGAAGTTTADLTATLTAAADLVAETRAAVS